MYGKVVCAIRNTLPVFFLKMQRDMLFSKERSLMLILALSVGIFTVGTMLGAMTTLRREMGRNYGSTVPATATLRTEDPLDEEKANAVSDLPGIRQVELRSVVRSLMKVGDRSLPILLFVIHDFDDIRLNRVLRESGNWPPPTGTMLVERTSLPLMRARMGDAIEVRTPHGHPDKVFISGVVHDPGLAPSRQEQMGYGYITPDTLHLLGEQRGWDELRIQVDPGFDAPAIARQAALVLGRSGSVVHEILIPPPGRHPHQGQMEAVLSMFLTFSLLTLALCAVLTTAVISTVMVRQTREIGIMKAAGATTSRFVLMYMGMIIVYAAIALLLAIPVSRLAAHFLTARIALLLNLEIADYSAPIWVYLAQAGAALSFPVIAASLPVWRASRIPVRDALDYRGAIVRLPLIAGRVLPLPLRNVLRNPARLILSVGLLSLGGALFMSALNVSDGWREKLMDVQRYRFYDLEVRVDPRGIPPGLVAEMKRMAEVEDMEVWSTDAAGFFDGSPFTMEQTYPDQGHGSFSLVGVPSSTRLVRFPVKEGVWLDASIPADRDAIRGVVLNHIARDRAIALGISAHPGDTVRISHAGMVSSYRVLGIVEDIGSQATAYVSDEGQGMAHPSILRSGATSLLRIRLRDRSPSSVVLTGRTIEAFLDEKHVPVDMFYSVGTLRNAVGEHMTVLTGTLTVAAILMGIVGLLGLISTMTMSIVERTRELGILRALGAGSSMIRGILLLEALWTVAGSLPVAWLLSLALSSGIGNLVGTMAFRTPLPLVSSVSGFGLWTGLILGGTIMTVLVPIRGALRISAREALAFDG